MPVLQPFLPDLAEALENAFIVVTANQRAARTLRHQFSLHQRALGRESWQPPAIFAWDEWLATLWHRLLREGHATALLLNHPQEQTLWRSIISADDAIAGSLRPADALAQTAADAWLRLHAYQGRDRLLAVPGSADTRTFARWAGEFERRCERSDYLTHSQLPEALRIAVATDNLPMANGLLLVGFDGRTPAQEALLDAFRANGVEIREVLAAHPSSSVVMASALDERAELVACSRWLRERLITRPESRIAVIVPALESSRARIDRVFREVLAPELNDIASPIESAPFEFSLGHPLAQMPMIAAAFDILRWPLAPLDIERASALLLSPYFASEGANAERLDRAEFDASILRRQKLLRPQVSLDELRRLASGKQAASLPILVRHLSALRPLFRQRDLASALRPFSDWAATMHDLLNAAGWASPTQLDSVEFQMRRKWEAALDLLATLDFESARVTFADALAAIERIAMDAVFAPESRHAPVQVMGPLESAGSSFDAIWFLHANDLAWPQAASPNPLLPWLLQRDLEMPGANSALDAARANRITQRIAGAAGDVIFSYAKQDSDGRLRPSSALTALSVELRDAATLSAVPELAQRIELDSVLDDAPIPSPADRVLAGGAAILQAQAACGFKAFAEKRLFSTALENPVLGLDARQRGSLVHAVLDNFWSEVRTQSRLKSMTRAQREEELNRAMDSAFARDYSRVGAGWPATYLDAERQRLLNLLLPWLEFEATMRAPFTVDSREKKLEDISIGPLRIAIRVDRIDQMDSGSDDTPQSRRLILDYKTGNATPADWLDERPKEPQLPIYAIFAGEEDLAGVAFGIIRPGTELAMRGYEAQPGILPKPSSLKVESFEHQLAEWRDVLTALAQRFFEGDASVSPKRYPGTCEFCEQRILCRLDVATLQADVTDESGPTEAEERDRG